MDIVRLKNVLDAIFIIKGMYMVVRQCIICGKEFDTKERSNAAKTCSKECSKINNQQHTNQWRQNNREHISQYNKQWYQNNCEHKQSMNKQWYQNNREYHSEWMARYKDRHPEKCDKDKREKETPGLKEAKTMARQNANYQCELTGWKGPNNVHHLNGYVFFPDQRADLNNLIVLHTDVHKHFHRVYGQKGDNTIDQFDQFVCDWFPLQVDNFRMNKYKYLPEHTYNT